MRSLRKRLRRVVLAVPVATACLHLGCSSPPAGSSSTGTSGGASGSSPSTAASSGGTGGTTGTGCGKFCDPTTYLCSPDSACVPTCEALCSCAYSEFATSDAGETHDGGELDPAFCDSQCPFPSNFVTDVADAGPANVRECHLEIMVDAGTLLGDGGEGVLVSCAWLETCSGRRPEGLVPLESTGRGTGSAAELRDYLATAARLESAAVPAFERLAVELRALGAPEALLERVERARDDEVRHARIMGRLASRHGAASCEVSVEPPRLRSPVEVALENAVEGCVRETFGAALAIWQSEHASDPELKEAMATIADEEAGHAELAWDIATWLELRLSSDERAAIEKAKGLAVQELRASLAAPVSPELRAWAGLPSAVEARVLFAGIAQEVWSAGHAPNC